MTALNTTSSLVQEAEQAIQTANVLRRIDRRLHADAWAWGRRFDEDGRTCLVGAIDEATRWTFAHVGRIVTEELASRLPRSLRIVARFDARIALMIYNDAPGGNKRVRRLVAQTLSELGGVPCQPTEFARAKRSAVRAPRPADHDERARRLWTA